MDTWTKLADNQTIQKTINALKTNGISAEVAENGEEAKKKVLAMIPQGAEVFTNTSITTDSIGLPKEIDESGKYDSVRNKLNRMDRKTQAKEMQRLGAAPEWMVGSVHAVTQDGKVLIVSNTGSQLAGYVYGAMHVIWVVGGQKVVKDVEQGKKRIYDYILPKETVRLRKQYNLPESVSSFVSKLLIVNKEINPERIKMIIVKEKLGF